VFVSSEAGIVQLSVVEGDAMMVSTARMVKGREKSVMRCAQCASTCVGGGR